MKDHNWNPKVVKIEKVFNKDLEYRFRKAKISAFSPYSDLKFHGTSQSSIDNIVKDGFKLPQKAGMFGKGIYFATNSSKSAQEIYTKGSQKLLLCKVLLGKYQTLHTSENTLNGIVYCY